VRRVAALLLLALLASGCTVEPPQVQGDLPQASAPRAANATLNSTLGNASLDAPAAWQHGQWWRYREHSADGSFDVRDTRVVTDDLSAAWRVDTDNVQISYFDALADVSTVGPVRKADLAGQQGGPVEFFRWPLVVNNTWPMTLDRQPLQVTVTAIAPSTFAGKAVTLAQFDATAGGKPYAHYTYIPEAGWFGTLQFFGPDGKATFGVDLEAWGQDYKGSVVRVGAAPRYHDAGASLQPQGSFDVAQGASFLALTLTATGDTVAGSVVLTPPDSSPPITINLGPCTANCSIAYQQQLNATPGTWHVASAAVINGSATPARAQLDVIAATVDRITIG
jgi:hypothetical protein